MLPFFTLVRRELGSHFLSLTGYVIIATVLLLLGFSLNDIVTKLNGVPIESPITEVIYYTIYFWMILLLTTPVITMRTFALEKFTGTFETLMTTPTVAIRPASPTTGRMTDQRVVIPPSHRMTARARVPSRTVRSGHRPSVAASSTPVSRTTG